MRAPGFFSYGLIVGILFLLLSNIPLAAAAKPNWDTDPTPQSFSANQGEYTKFAISFVGSDDFDIFDNSLVRVCINWTYIPTGFQVSWNDADPTHSDYIMTVEGNSISYSEGWVYVTTGASWDVPQTLEYDIWIYYNFQGIYSSWDVKHDSIIVTPRQVRRWSVTAGPYYASLYKGENQNYTITIYNYTSVAVYWDINTTFIHSGFSVNPTTGSIEVPANGSKSWITKVTPTGQGLVQNELYLAANFWCTYRPTGEGVSGGYISITYLSAPENESDFQLWFDPVSLQVSETEVGHIDLYVKNIGASTMKYHISYCIAASWGVNQPITELTINSDENSKWTIGVWHLPAHEGYDYTDLIVKVQDNAGVERNRSARITLISGKFSITLYPEEIRLLRGGSAEVELRIKNNENDNRSYQVAWLGGYVIEAVPLTASVDNLGGYASTSLKFTIFAKANIEIAIYPYPLYVKCIETGGWIDEFLNVEIYEGIPGPGLSPGMISFLSLFAPLTGGDLTLAGYFCAVFFFIIPLAVVGLALAARASRENKGLVTVIFTLLGIIISSALGIIPLWIPIFIILIIALSVSKGYWWK